MIEILFGDSACGSIKMAQSYGKGEYQTGGAIGVFISHEDGRKPTKKEIDAIRREYEERERSAWERAIPLGGRSSDIYGFWLMLSMGDISENQPDVERIKVLECVYSIFPDSDGRRTAQEMMKKVNENLKAVRERVDLGETVRIWYSNQPDEMCGLYWFMHQLNQWKVSDGQVCIVKLPEWEEDANGTIVRKTNWGETHPGEWYKYIEMQKNVSDIFIRDCASHWSELQKENSPLRIVLNGQLVSASEKIYDDLIISEIKAEGDEFREAMIIGRILGKYRLGISDSLISFRIEEMISEGKLMVVSEAEEDMPVYHRKLKKY